MLIAAALAAVVLCWGSYVLLEPALARRLRRPPAASPPAAQVPDYARPLLSAQEKWLICFTAGLLLFALGYLFYKSAAVSAGMSLLGAFAPRFYGRRKVRLRREALQQHFRQLLQSLSASLSAGRSLEHAFRAAEDDMRLIYPEGNIDMIVELGVLVKRLDNGETLERALHDLAERSGVSDIRQLVDIVTVGKRAGGDMIEVLRRSSDMIGEKLEIQQDIAVLIAQKRFEARALCMIPPLIIAVLSFGSAEYMQPLYSGGGRGIMTLAWIGLAGCAGWMNAIFRFRI